ncbi:Cell cycle checkpoint protein RAD17 [Heracleum sosnowskyi]|uniref:Cell cycle checkpoint protein RAD17 n=1 Tax=Heracleum sosnowskyi TaxID=360622 RepID=A0AAD8ILU9_9APIA|nr:Cell cycle checkpoint protein RAD17 [Heracleum sosnowskyi]
MRKRTKPIVVVSSSDEDDEKQHHTHNYKSSLLTSSSSSSVPPRSKKSKKAPRLSSSCSKSRIDSNPFDQVKLFCEGFDDGFTGFQVLAEEKNKKKELWVDKYRPRTLEELAVHKKKVEEVRTWFEERLKKEKQENNNHVLLITGQTGIGKSETVRVIASHLGAILYEWKTPTPTIWQEHVHNSGSGIRYTSKLDEFENFVERIRKYGLISSSDKKGSQKTHFLLIDDLPVISGKVSYERLRCSLHLLVQSIRIPTAIIVTDCGQSDSADYSMRCWEELQLSIQSAGACKVAFNPITVNSIKKTLSRICREEHKKVTTEQNDLIAKASGGDIRHAILSLEYLCLKPNPMLSLSLSDGNPTYPEVRSELDDGNLLPFGRDETLSLFHALGKFLHNKRATQNSVASDNGAFCLKDQYMRSPLNMDAPEKVLCQAHGQAKTVTDFLHENVLDFINEEAIDDAWTVSSYLSDADTLLASLGGLLIRNYEASNIVQSAAASVAARGVLFGNTHPLSSRWHAVRRPRMWQVEKSMWHNKREMVSQRSVPCNGMNLTDFSIITTEWRPSLKWLGFKASHSEAVHGVPINGSIVEDGGYDDPMCIDEQSAQTTDDEIEDW